MKILNSYKINLESRKAERAIRREMEAKVRRAKELDREEEKMLNKREYWMSKDLFRPSYR